MTVVRRGWPWRPAIVVLAGTIFFGVLSMLAARANDENEQGLLQRMTEESGSVIALEIARILTPIQNAAEVAEATDGDAETFTRLLTPYQSARYVSMSLIDRESGERLALVGSEPLLPEIAPTGVDDAVKSTRVHPVVVVDLLDEDRRLGYAVVNDVDASRFAIYLERSLPEEANERSLDTPPLRRLNYAIYLGDAESDVNLLGASGTELPLTGRRAHTSVDYGDKDVLIVTSPIGRLGSPLMHNLWWIVLLNGVAATSVTAFLLHRLDRRRGEAVQLAKDASARHDEQRDIAETLQLSLLPDRLSSPPSAEMAARYWTAGTASLIGGDFYDAFQIDDRRWGMLIGDVCGKGIESAALIGLVRHTVRASAMYTDSPAAALYAVHMAVAVHEPPTFCTAAFMVYAPDADDVLDTEAGMGTLVLALAGHPQPVLGGADGSARPIGSHGTLLGMIEPHITDETYRIRSGDTLLLYTDGLTDAPRGQAVDLEELVDVMSRAHERDVDDVADGIRRIKRSRRPEGSADDTAVVTVRFAVTQASEIPPEPVAQGPAVDV